MKKQLLIIGVILITFGAILITSSVASAQGGSEFTVPLSDPAKRGKLRAHINYGSITVKGTARKDVLVKYTPDEDNDEQPERPERPERGRVDVKVNVNTNTSSSKEADKSKEGLKKISGSTLDLEASETGNV